MGREKRQIGEQLKACLVTDAKSRYDVLFVEKVMWADRRLSLEDALLREALEKQHEDQVGQVGADVGKLLDEDWRGYDLS